MRTQRIRALVRERGAIGIYRMNYAKAQFELLSRKLDQYSVEQLEAVIAILKPKEHVNGSQASTIVSTETHSA